MKVLDNIIARGVIDLMLHREYLLAIMAVYQKRTMPINAGN